MSGGGDKPLGSLGPVDRWIRWAAGVCGVLFLLKIVLVLTTHAWGHAHFAVEAWPGFFEAVGFFGFALLVLAGRALGRWVRRPEGYYDPELGKEGDDHA